MVGEPATSLFLILEDQSFLESENRETDQPNGKRLIVHADDFGLCASVNRATIAALEGKAISSASLMVPCEYFQPAADYAARHREMDIGLHLTVTSEWPAAR